MGIGKAVLSAALAAVLVYVLFELRHAFLMLYAAAVLAVLFDPLCRSIRRLRLRGWRPGRGAATAIVVVLVAVALALIGFAVVPPVMADAHRLSNDWPAMSARLQAWFSRHVPFGESLADQLLASGRRWRSQVPLITVGASSLDVLITLLIAIYALSEGPAAFAWLMSLVPESRRRRLEAALRAGATRMQRWSAGQGLLMLTHGASALITFWLIGLPYAVPLAVFAGAVNVIPVLGPILLLAAASLVAAIDAPGKLLGVVLFYLAYHNAESIYLQPRIMSSAVGIPALTVVVALAIGGEIAGIGAWSCRCRRRYSWRSSNAATCCSEARQRAAAPRQSCYRTNRRRANSTAPIRGTSIASSVPARRCRTGSLDGVMPPRA